MAASRNPLVRLGHIREEIANLTIALVDVDFDAFTGSYVLRRTTEHAILIISEAVKSLPPEMTDSHSNIDWRAVRTIGNVLRHDYFAIDVNVLWRIAKEHLPELLIVVDAMIAERSA